MDEAAKRSEEVRKVKQQKENEILGAVRLTVTGETMPTSNSSPHDQEQRSSPQALTRSEQKP